MSSSEPDLALTVDQASERYNKLAEDPLCHPAIYARECFDHAHDVPPHLAQIYQDVFDATDEETSGFQRICNILPREHGKSVAGTTVSASWAALNDPNIRILIMSETTAQAKRKLSETRETVRRLAPRFGHSIVTDNTGAIQLEREESYDVPTILAAGFDSGVTGGHFDLIIFDDVVSWKSQRTEARREKAWAKFQDYQNLGSGGDTTYLVLGTRKHEEDLYSNLINGPAWKDTVRKAISDFSIVENREFSIVTDKGNEYPGIALGNIPSGEGVPNASHIRPHRNVAVLWPERWPLNKLIYDLISGFGSDESTAVWRREKQNDASAMSGEILKRDMLIDTDEFPGKPNDCIWVAGLDPAIEEDPEKSATGDTDWWACAILAHNPIDNQTVVVNVERERGMTVQKGIEWLRQCISDYPVTDVLAETVQAQHWLVQVAKEEGIPIRATTSSGNKRRRLISMSAQFERGQVKLLNFNQKFGYGRTDWSNFESEWLNFPSDHDDQLDSVELALRGVDTNSIQRVPATW